MLHHHHAELPRLGGRPDHGPGAGVPPAGAGRHLGAADLQIFRSIRCSRTTELNTARTSDRSLSRRVVARDAVGLQLGADRPDGQVRRQAVFELGEWHG